MLRSASRLLPTRLSSVLVQSASLESLEAVNDALSLQLVQESGEQSSLLVPLVWLRDHCRSPSLYNHSTNQRTSNMVNLFEEAKVQGQKDVEIHEQRTIHINWMNGLKSKYDIDELLKCCLNRNLPSTSENITAWDSSWDARIPRLNVSNFSFAEFCQLFIRYGVVIIDGVEVNAEATEKLCREIAPIHDTYYGSFWVFSNETKNEDYHEDTAYGQQAIGPHTDGTYFEQTPGIQVFHCLTPAEEGGDTILVDGKRCVDILRDENPAAYQLLTTKLVDHHYLEGGDDGNVLNCVGRHRPVIEVDSQENLVQLRFNPYDRAPLKSLRYDDPASAKETLQFYKAYSRLSQICHDPVNSIRTSLRPGSVIFIDNFRVLHARTAFKGFREMSGCYLSRDNLLAKARPHLNKDIRYVI